jgi:hypothetical protein
MGNTGSKAWLRLEEYNTGDSSATGNYKVNDSGDPDYVAPVTDYTTCPLPPGTDITAPTFPTTLSWTKPMSSATTVDLTWSSSDNVGVVRQRLYYKLSTDSVYTTVNLSKTAGSYSLGGLTTGSSYNVFVRAWDAWNNYTDSSVTATPNPSITISPTQYNDIAVGGTTFNMTITTTPQFGWQIPGQSLPQWVTPQYTTNAGTITMSITVDSNQGNYSERFASIFFELTSDTSIYKILNIHQIADTADPTTT